MLETSALKFLYDGQITLSIPLIKQNICLHSPPTQHHSFHRDQPPYLAIGSYLQRVPKLDNLIAP